MNEKVKSILIKITLTIPALLIGILSAIIFILKPLRDVWFPATKVEPVPVIKPEEPIVKHDFH